MDTKINTNKLKEFIYNKFINDELDNESLVQIIELCGSLLNMQTISKYSKIRNISYNGAKKNKFKRNILGVNWIINNE